MTPTPAQRAAQQRDQYGQRSAALYVLGVIESRLQTCSADANAGELLAAIEAVFADNDLDAERADLTVLRRSCSHGESLYGRCVRCGMTWEQQAEARNQQVPEAGR